LVALHVSSDIIPHHQEHINCSYMFWLYSHVTEVSSYSAMTAANNDTRE